MYFSLLFVLSLLLSPRLQAQSHASASEQHARALEQLQSQYPDAVPVDVPALRQATPIQSACNTCPPGRPAPVAPPPPPTKAALEEARDRLVRQLVILHQAEPVDEGLVQKYQQALRVKQAQLAQWDAPKRPVHTQP